MILYANSGWEPAHGGELRLYDATRCDQDRPCGRAAADERPPYWDVAPLAGSIVVFDSMLRHEVRPSWAERFALTLWLWREEGPEDMAERS